MTESRDDADVSPDVQRYWPWSFADRLTGSVPGWREALRAAASVHWKVHRGSSGAPYRPAPVPRVGAESIAITWIGHATCLIQIGGKAILTDPVWSSNLLGLCRRQVPPGVAWKDLPPLDAIVISHNHRDHLDAPTISRLPRDVPVMVPAALAGWFLRRGFSTVTEMDWWESTELADLRFDFVPAHHWSQRTPFDNCRTLWGGWILSSEKGQRVYFAGDTGWGHRFGEIGARFDGIDVAVLPIGAYALGKARSAMHLDPSQAVQACLDVGARRLMPMHWGTFRLSTEPMSEPIRLVRSAWSGAGRAMPDLLDLAIGETRIVDGS